MSMLNDESDAMSPDKNSTGICQPQSVKPNLKSYIGTKVILARPMTEHEFLMTVKGKSKEELQQQETQGNGYEVTYEDGYISWSPKGVFEKCYRQISRKEENLIDAAKFSMQNPDTDL